MAGAGGAGGSSSERSSGDGEESLYATIRKVIIFITIVVQMTSLVKLARILESEMTGILHKYFQEEEESSKKSDIREI